MLLVQSVMIDDLSNRLQRSCVCYRK